MEGAVRARELPEDSPCRPRGALAGKEARQLAREILEMNLASYPAAFRGVPVKRARLPAMQRNAAVVLGNVGTADDVDVLTRATDDAGPPVRVHAAHALAVIAQRSAPRSPARGADGDRAR